MDGEPQGASARGRRERGELRGWERKRKDGEEQARRPGGSTKVSEMKTKWEKRQFEKYKEHIEEVAATDHLAPEAKKLIEL